MTKGMPILMGCLLVLASATGCATISDDAKKDLAKQVDCNTAEQDIATLEAEKASVAKRVAAGVRMVVPTMMVQGLLTRDLGNRKEVATGEYNAMLEKKIAEIRRECGI